MVSCVLIFAYNLAQRLPKYHVGINSAGAALGAIHNAWSADRFSRKHTMQIGAIILIAGAALCAGSVNKEMFIAARFISGWGIGILISVIPM